MSDISSRSRSSSPEETAVTANAEDDDDFDFEGQGSSEGGEDSDSEDDVPLNLRRSSRYTLLSESDSSDSEAEAPKEPQKKRSKKENAAKKFDENWHQEGLRKDFAVKDFTGSQAIHGLHSQRESAEKQTPLACFDRFWTLDMKKLIVEETAAYIDFLKLVPRPINYTRGKTWPPVWVTKFTPLTVQELDLWVGILLLMGMSHKGNVHNFWSEHYLFQRIPPKVVMTRDRFKAIKWGIHCQDSDWQREHPNTMRKVGRLLDMFRDRCRTVYSPGRDLALDEMMLKCRCRVSFRFMASYKPIKYGLRNYALCESETGYLADFRLDMKDGTKVQEHVLKLLEHAKGKNHVVYMDNFFCTVDTFTKALDMGIYACGTCRAGCGTPSWLQKKSGPKLTEPGDYFFSYHKNLKMVAVKWMDSGACTGLTTFHNAEECQIKRAEKGNRERVLRKTLTMWRDYNMKMNGVDKNDQRRAAWTCRLRSKKWWHAPLFWTIDTSAINGHVIYQKRAGVKTGRYDFMVGLINGLFARGLGARYDDLTKVKIEELRQTRLPKDMDKWPATRLEGGHYPSATAMGAKERVRLRCVVCAYYLRGTKKKQRTTYECTTCKVALCLECFKTFHEDVVPRNRL